MVDHNDGRATRQSCSVCTVAGPSEVGENATLCKLTGDLQEALAQATRVMAAMANELWSGHAAPSETASSVASVLDSVLTPLALANGHTWPRVNPTVEVAVDAHIIIVSERWIHATSVSLTMGISIL